MRNSKRYILVAAIAAAVFAWRFGWFLGGYENVLSSGKGIFMAEEWNPLIAGSVNEKTITVNIDGRQYTNRDIPVFMDDKLDIMVPTDILTEGLKCSSHLYEEKELLIEKRNDTVSLELNQPEILVNKTARKIHSPMIRKDGRYYISLGEVAENIGYSFEWDIEKNQVSARDVSETASIFPARYDLREKKRVGAVKNQADTGTC